jgi:cytoskeletal protein CcmA (bactofilin family)
VDLSKPGEVNREAPLTGAHIGKSVVIKGELSGSENLFVDGEVQGSIQLDGHGLTIGQNGRVRANLKAKDVVVHGRVDGAITAGDRLDLRKTAVVMGDVQARRLSIEDGAFLKGNVETSNAAQTSTQPQREVKASAVVASAGAGNSGAAVPVSVSEPKR